MKRRRRHLVHIRLRVHRTPDAVCDRKRRYPCECTARATAFRLFEIGVVTVACLFPYRCPACRGWHLSKNPFLNAQTAPVTADDLYTSGDHRHG